MPRMHALDENRQWKIFSVLTVVLLFVLATIFGYIPTTLTASKLSKSQLSQQDSQKYRSNPMSTALNDFLIVTGNDAPVAIRITNEYSDRPDAPKMFPYPFLQSDEGADAGDGGASDGGGAHLMEPHRESTVVAEGLSSECGVSWRLERHGEASGVGAVADGHSSTASSFAVEAKGPGKHVLALMQQCTGRRSEFVVQVRYVRRELSTLTDRDREEFLDAMYVVFTTSTEEGKKLYGERYKSHAYLSVIHLDGQDNGYCDQFHDGPGFLAGHMYLQAYLEQSLQLVNPRTCLHYWETIKLFTSDSYAEHLVNQLDGGSYSEIMTEKWFGRNDPLSGRILDGRWRDFQVPLMDDAFFAAEGIDKDANFFPENDAEYRAYNTYMHTTSPYGYLRTAWNYNPSPYLTRYNNFERIMDILAADSTASFTCADLEDDLLGYVGLSVANVSDVMSGSRLHGEPHWLTGGMGGEESAQSDALLREKFNFDDATIIKFTNSIFTWRRSDHKFIAGEETELFDCANAPFNYTTGIQKFNTPPGAPGSLQCPLKPSYFESEVKIDILLRKDFEDLIESLTFEQKVELLNIVSERFSYPGDMVYSSSVADPLFWLIHGPFERMLQLLHFEGAMSSEVLDHVDDCAGHDADATKAWLSGFYMQDGTDAGTLTLKQLQKIMNPLTEEFEVLNNFVYDSGEWSYCPNALPKLREAISNM